MKQLSILAFGLLVIFCSSCGGENKEQTGADTTAVKIDTVPSGPKLELAWETDTVLTTCESALNVAGQGIFVSCINGDPMNKDGNGFISKVSVDGKVETVNWSKGKLDAPKGMGVLDNFLYVTDINDLVKIDLKTGKVAKRIKVPNTQFLNDVTVDTAGKTVYFSDTYASVIFSCKNDAVSVFLNDTNQIKNPNGLLFRGDKMYVATFNGDFKEIEIASKNVRQVANGIGGGDGVVYSSSQNQFIVSNWFGEIFVVSPEGTLTKVLDTKDQKLNAADIDFIEDKNLVLVPAFSGNKLMTYQVKW